MTNDEYLVLLMLKDFFRSTPPIWQRDLSLVMLSVANVISNLTEYNVSYQLLLFRSANEKKQGDETLM